MLDEARIISVHDLTGLVQKILENEHLLTNLWVRGEISNFKAHITGHLYFSLKDSQTTIKAVMFKSRAWNLTFSPKDGMDCLVRGYVSLYAKETQLQFYAEEIIPAGVGLQSLALEELKKKLKSKGYFRPELKKPLPLLPHGVGVVTSAKGAAIRDIDKVVQRRYPGMPIILYPALVQGEKAAQELVKGITILGARTDIDVLILARGGGSLEDLAAFNTETVAEAIFHCPKPIISAIGHEIDITLADLVADARAATPSMAGEMAVPVKLELNLLIEKLRERLQRAVQVRLEKQQMLLTHLAATTLFRKPERWLQSYYEEITRQESLLINKTCLLLEKKGQQLAFFAGKLQALSPLATMARGYSICKNQDGVILTSPNQVKVGEKLSVRLFAGEIETQVLEKEESANDKRE